VRAGSAAPNSALRRSQLRRCRRCGGAMAPRALLLPLLLAVAAAEPALTSSAADDAATAVGAAPSRPAAFHRAAKVSSGAEGRWG